MAKTKKAKPKKKTAKKKGKKRIPNFAEAVTGDAKLLNDAYDDAHRRAGM